jgi:RNA polymerase sigma factor, sigma-70 family
MLFHGSQYGDLSLEQLVYKAQQGDQYAANQLIGLFYKKICKYYVRNIRLSLETAEELTQDTFEKAWRKLPMLQDLQRFEGWLYAIAKNVALDYLRKVKRRNIVVLPIDQDFEMADNAPLVENQVLAQMNIAETLGTMPGKLRECLLLHFVENLTTQEVAVRLCIGEDTVKAYISKARVRLREELYYLKEDRGNDESRRCEA